MPPKKPTISRETAPPGLLAVADLVARIPERKGELIEYELKRREHARVQLAELRQRLSWHPVQTIRSVILYGVNAFILAWAAGSLAAVGQSYDALKAGTLDVPFFGGAGLQLDSFVPTSTTLSVASRLPRFTFEQALFIGAAIALTVVIMRLIVMAFRWKRLQQVREEEKNLEEEIRVLMEWQTTVQKPNGQKKERAPIENTSV